jgi:hypothetical protein
MPTQLQRTREFVEQTFQQVDEQIMLPLREAAIIRAGHYCGHRFMSGRLSAVWFFEEDEVKIYGDDGHLIDVKHVYQKLRKAA